MNFSLVWTEKGLLARMGLNRQLWLKAAESFAENTAEG